MTQGDNLLEEEAGSAPSGRGGIIGWVIFFFLFGAIALFGYRVWFYTMKIRNGELIVLPQFSAQLTRGGTSTSADAVPPALIETTASPALGAEQPKLTIVGFADFECPYSKEAAGIARRMMARYGDRVRFEYRAFPLTTIHPDAYQAAVAAECANEQDKFWEYHDKLYVNSHALHFADLIRYAEEMGMDHQKFETCLAENRYKTKVDADVKAGQTVGVGGTPTFFFNGRKVEGMIPEDAFERVIGQLLLQAT